MTDIRFDESVFYILVIVGMVQCSNTDSIEQELNRLNKNIELVNNIERKVVDEGTTKSKTILFIKKTED